MPRIPGPTEPRGVPGVISLPRPREVQQQPTLPALRSPLVDFGNALSQSGLAVSQHLIQQERDALRTKLHLQAVEQYGALENEVDQAGTASEAHAIWDEKFPSIVEGLEQSATELGVPEFAGELNVIGARSKISTLNAISRRSAQEGVDNIKALSVAYGHRLAGARTQTDYIGVRAELHGRLQQVAATNPLFSPGDADATLLAVVSDGAKRRAMALVEGSMGNLDALAAAKASILDPNQHPDLPVDARADLVRLADQLEESAIDRAWQRSRRSEILFKEGREKHQLATMQGFMGRLAQDENVTDTELQLAVANGALDPTAFSFLQRARDKDLDANPNVLVYDDHRTQAEFGLLDPAEVNAAMEAGAYTWSEGQKLLDNNTSSRRMGGILRDAEVEAGRDIIVNLVLGAVGDDPTQQVWAFFNASDREKRIYMNLTTRYDETIRRAVAEGTPIETLNPRRLAGELLKDAGFAPQRPSLPELPGPFNFRVLGGLSPTEIETDEERGIPAIVNRLAGGGLSVEAENELERQLQAARGYVDELKQWQMNTETMKTLMDALPREAR